MRSNIMVSKASSAYICVLFEGSKSFLTDARLIDLAEANHIPSTSLNLGQSEEFLGTPR